MRSRATNFPSRVIRGRRDSAFSALRQFHSRPVSRTGTDGLDDARETGLRTAGGVDSGDACRCGPILAPAPGSRGAGRRHSGGRRRSGSADGPGHRRRRTHRTSFRVTSLPRRQPRRGASVLAGRHAGRLAEGRGHVGLAGKAARERDLGEGEPRPDTSSRHLSTRFPMTYRIGLIPVSALNARAKWKRLTPAISAKLLNEICSAMFSSTKCSSRRSLNFGMRVGRSLAPLTNASSSRCPARTRSEHVNMTQ